VRVLHWGGGGKKKTLKKEMENVTNYYSGIESA